MNNRSKGLAIGMSGFLAGVCVAHGVAAELATGPKFLVVVATSVVVSALVWLFFRPSQAE
jgi:hypothetical protein